MEDIREKSRVFITQSRKKTIHLVRTSENEYRENRREKIVKDRKEDTCLELTKTTDQIHHPDMSQLKFRNSKEKKDPNKLGKNKIGYLQNNM